tara:strand:+ start:4147 stop:4407 length:261 start_codon:yes stop_codon:yes gene_type:complete
MKKLRKVNTSKRKKEIKETQKQLAERAGMMLDMPEECCVCSSPFDKKNKEMATTWHVVVMDKKKKIYLTCPSCWKAVKEEANKSET